MSEPDESGVSPALDQGEALLWRGRPCSRFALMKVALFECVFGLVFVVFTGFWAYNVVHFGGRWDRGNVPPFAPHNVRLAAIACLIGIPVGLVMVLSPVRAWRRSGRTHYLLTDRRAIVCEISGARCRITGELHPHLLGQLKIRHYADGSGDLIFGTRPTMVQGTYQPYGFIGVEDAAKVGALLQKTLR